MAEGEKVKKKKLTKLEKWFRFLRRLYKYFVCAFLPIKRYGNYKFNNRSYIFVGNHLSVLDIIPVAVTVDRPVYYMAKKELFEKGFMKWLMLKSECISVNRDGSDVKALMQAMKILKNGGIVNIFPEGTRNKTDQMFLPFKSGATTLAIRTKTPIIPMIQVKKIKFFRTTRVYFGDPLEFTEFYDRKLTPEDYEIADKMLLDKMTELYINFAELLKNKKKK